MSEDIKEIQSASSPSGTLQEQPLALQRKRNKIRIDGWQYARRLSEKANPKHWLVRVLEVAWTGVPVTFLAMHGSHYLTYGKLAPSSTFYYFSLYTIIMGLIAVIAHYLGTLVKNLRAQKDEANLSHTLVVLPDLIATSQDLGDRFFSVGERLKRVCVRVLRNSSASVEEVRLAIDKTMNWKELSDTLAWIESLRRMGSFSAMEDAYLDFNQQSPNWEAKIQETCPEVLPALKMRLTGRGPTVRQGLPRSTGFIDRITRSIEKDDLELMSLGDAEEMFRLCFELLCGRKIEMINFKFRGDKKIQECSQELELARSRYRNSRTRFLGRVRTLVHLGFQGERFLPMGSFDLNQCQKVVEELITHLKNNPAKASNNPGRKERERLERLHLHCKQQWPYLIAAQKELYESWNRLEKSIQNWEKVAAKNGFDSNLITSKDTDGLYLSEEEIALDDSQKVEFAREFANMVSNLTVLQNRRLYFMESEDSDYQPVGHQQVKELAQFCYELLGRNINLSLPLVQYVLESSNGANLGGLVRTLSTATTIAWGRIFANEVQKDLQRAAKQLAWVLVHHYKMELCEEARSFFFSQYGLAPEELERVLAIEDPRSGLVEVAKPPAIKIPAFPRI